jgi:hypothetical protein
MLAGPGITNDPAVLQAGDQIRTDLLTRAYGTRSPQWRTKDEGKNNTK